MPNKSSMSAVGPEADIIATCPEDGDRQLLAVFGHHLIASTRPEGTALLGSQGWCGGNKWAVVSVFPERLDLITSSKQSLGCVVFVV